MVRSIYRVFPVLNAWPDHCASSLLAPSTTLLLPLTGVRISSSTMNGATGVSGSWTVPLPTDKASLSKEADWIAEIGLGDGKPSVSGTIAYGTSLYCSTLLGDTGRWWGNYVYDELN